MLDVVDHERRPGRDERQVDPAPGDGRATLPRAADSWIRPVANRAREAGDAALADRQADSVLSAR